ncbi:MAG: hypothetical protein KH009_04955 [Clostridiales bacterium]|nr:hypothetical protein [Clostridiales bacterium]
MKNCVRKFSVAALAAVMAVSMTSVAFAEEGPFKIGNDSFTTLPAAVEAAQSGDTIVMTADTTGDGVVVKDGKNLTFDFGGFTYTVNEHTVGSTGTETNGFQLKKDSNVVMKNGTIAAGGEAKILIQNYADLTLENVTLDARNNSSVDYVMSNNCGEVLLTGKTNIYAAPGAYAFDVCWAPNNGYPEGTQVTVNTTGTIQGNVEVGVWGSLSEQTPPASTLTVDGGSFEGELEVDSRLVDPSKENVAVNAGLFTDDTWTNEDYTKNAQVAAEITTGGDTVYYFGRSNEDINAEGADSVTITKAVSGRVSVAGEGVKVTNGTAGNISVNGDTVPAGKDIVVDKEYEEKSRESSGDYYGTEKWDEVKRQIRTADEGDTIKVSATGLPYFPSSVARELRGKDITLEIRKNGVTYKVNGLAIGEIDKIWYEFENIEAQLLTAEAPEEDKAAETQTAPTVEKTNPDTGR